MARDAVGEIRDRTDIVDLITPYSKLRKAGRSFKGLCPFHQEKTPSFIVFPESGTFHCFGCGRGGDVFTFYMEAEKADFREALSELAKRAGVELDNRPLPSPERDAHRNRLVELNELAATFYATQLKASDAGKPGRDLATKRGISGEMVEAFQLGYAPDAWDTLAKYLAARGVDPELAVQAGLLAERQSGGHYDRFRARLLFPIRDREGAVLGFGGRAMGDEQPKYLNTAQSAIFDKSGLLYGLDRAAEAIRKADQVVLVEGYMDVIAAHQHGYRNVVATMGTAVTERQLALVKRLSQRVVMALDADAAGQMATLRTIESIGEAADDEEAVADPAGMIRFERRLKTDISIVELPSGKDPDELIRSAPESWPDVVKTARPFLEFFITRVADGVDQNDPKAKSAAVARIAPLLRLVPDRIVQSHYVDLTAGLLKIADRRLVLQQVRPNVASPAARPGQVRGQAGARVDAEENLMALLLTHRTILDAFALTISPMELRDARHRQLLALLHEEDAAAQPIDQLLEGVDPTIAERAHTLLESLLARPPMVAVQVVKEAQRTLDTLRRERQETLLRSLQGEIETAQRENDSETLDMLLPRLTALADGHRALYPPPSPYFRDARDKPSGQLSRPSKP